MGVGCKVTSVSSGALSDEPSLTTRRKRSVAGAPTGVARKLGVARFVFSKSTGGPESCAHMNVSGSPSGSKLPVPSSTTVVALVALMICLRPVWANGGRFAAGGAILPKYAGDHVAG